MKWIKASERPDPGITKWHIIRWNYGVAQVYTDNTGAILSYCVINNILFEQVEWLDESTAPTPVSSEKGKDEIKFDTKFKFGDIVENYWASEMNPHRKGIVVKVLANKSLYCTDGHGDFWNLVNDKDSKTKIIGHYSYTNTTPSTPQGEVEQELKRPFVVLLPTDEQLADGLPYFNSDKENDACVKGAEWVVEFIAKKLKDPSSWQSLSSESSEAVGMLERILKIDDAAFKLPSFNVSKLKSEIKQVLNQSKP